MTDRDAVTRDALWPHHRLHAKYEQLRAEHEQLRAEVIKLRSTQKYLRHRLWTFGYFSDGKTREDLRNEARAAYKATA